MTETNGAEAMRNTMRVLLGCVGGALLLANLVQAGPALSTGDAIRQEMNARAAEDRARLERIAKANEERRQATAEASEQRRSSRDSVGRNAGSSKPVK